MSYKSYQISSDKWLLVGSFLLIFGTFLPWYDFRWEAEIPWTGIEFSGIVYGYSLLLGQIFIVLAAILAVLVLIPHREEFKSKMFQGQMFVGSLIVLIYLINILFHPIFLVPAVLPHAGIWVLLIGCISIIYGLGKLYRSLQQ